MIVALRSFTQGKIRGANILLLRDFVPYFDELAESVFKSFDESLNKTKLDPDATRLFSANDPQPGTLSRAVTAESAALRALPERHRPSAKLFSALCFQESDKRLLHCHLPTWAELHSEARDGTLSRVATHAPSAEWFTLPIREEDLFFHLSLMGPPSLRADPGRNIFTTLRISDLIERAPCPYLRLQLSLAARELSL